MQTDAVKAIRDLLAGLQAEDTPKSMPPAYYTSPEFLELELEALFRNEWVCVGHVGEVPEKGDFFATEVADEPLLVLRGDDGDVAVFSNVCRHRGIVLAQGSGRQKRFTCTYHGWTYGNDGRLLAAPHMDRVPGFEKASCRLPKFASEVWNGFIYVNLSGDAPPLADRLAGLDAIIANYDLAARQIVHAEDDEWNTNWKCLAENFMEGYHLTTTHPRTLHPITPTSLCEKMPSGEYYTGYWAGYDPATPDRKPYPPRLTEEERRRSPMFWVAPNHVVGLATNNCVYMCLRPRGADHVGIRWGVLSTVGPQDPVAKDYVALCNAFNAEDKAKLEQLQRGLRSRFLERNFLAPADFEGTIWDIYGFVARRLGSGVKLCQPPAG